jgi:hypothetical protein
MAVLASAAKQGQVHSAAMPDQETNTTQKPVVILAAAAVYTINVWSTTKKETSPAKNLEQGIERIKDAAGKAIESRN